MANSFTNVNRWMEIAKTSYEAMGSVVANVCQALGNVNIQDIDLALTRVARKEEVMERDVWIAQLTQEKAELQSRLTKAKADLKMEEARIKGAHKLMGLLEEHVYNTGEVVTKAQLYNEAVAKTGGITALKLIHIFVAYFARMETILAEIWTLFTARNRFFRNSPTPLDMVRDLIEFLDLSPVGVLQNLHTLTTLRTNLESVRSGKRNDPGSDARSKDAGRTKPEEVSTPATDSTPSLPTKPAPLVPSPTASSPGLVNPQPSPSLTIPPLTESARLFVESVRRQTTLIQSPSFQDLLNRT